MQIQIQENQIIITSVIIGWGMSQMGLIFKLE